MPRDVTPSPRRARLRGLAAKVALALASVAAALVATEAGVRLLTRTPPALLQSDPRVGKRFRPGFAGTVVVPECGCEVALRFDREGLRGPERPRAKPPGTRRLALVGDSMIAAVATREERTLARRLEARLAASRPGAGWEVMNAGVSSSSTGSELALYREVLSGYAPDLVVLVFWVGNDLADNSRELTRAPRLYFELDAAGRLRQLPLARGPLHPLADWLDRHSRLYAWQKTALRQARFRLRGPRAGLEAVELVFAQPEPEPVQRAWALTAALVSTFAAETAARGTRLALVAAAPAPQVYDDLWAELARRAARDAIPVARDHPDARLRAIALEAGVPFIALREAFVAAAPSADSARLDERLYYDGRFHWNDAGNALAADAIHAFLLASGLLDGPPQGSTAAVQ